MKNPPDPIRIMDIRGTHKGGGGPDKTVLMSALLHDKSRFRVLVTYLRDPKDHEFQVTKKAKEMGVPLFVEVPDRRLLDFSCILWLSRLLRAHRIDLFHAHDDKTALYGLLLQGLHPRLKIVYTCHLILDYEQGDFRSWLGYVNYRARKSTLLFLIRRFKKPIMAVSGFCKNQLVREGIQEWDVVVLYNGIDTDCWQRENGTPRLREELGLRLDDPLIGTVARIDYQKDLSTFLKVADAVTAKIPSARFVIVGDGKGDELLRIKKEAKRMDLGSKVHFTGHRNDLIDVYASFDLFLMTSNNEGLPNTVLEAMAMKVPVVSTAVAGVPELVVEAKTGFLCSIGDTDGLTKRVVELLEDSKTRLTFAEAGRCRVVELFSFRGRVKKLEALYEQYASGG